MAAYYSDNEQIDRLKAWWKQYSRFILISVLALAVIVGGWRWWYQQRTTVINNASVIYERLLGQLAEADTVQSQVYAEDLVTHYPNTIYGQMAALILAREAVYSEDITQAQQQLQGLINQGKDPVLRQIARIRLARLLLSEGEGQQALESLATIDDEAYLGLVREVEGDIYVYEGDPEKAREVYTQALSFYAQSGQHPLLQLKLNNL